MARATKFKAKKTNGQANKRAPRKAERPATARRGDNSGDASANDDVYERHLKKIAQRQAELAVSKANLRSAFDAAELEGVNVQGIKLAQRLGRRDRQAVLELYAAAGRVMRLSNSPLAKQLQLFETAAAEPGPEQAEPPRPPIEEAARS